MMHPEISNHKKLIPAVCILFALIALQAAGQTDSTVSHVKKNEIGVNIAPLILITLGGNPYSQAPGITYKRVFNNWAARMNFTYIPSVNYPYTNIIESKTADTTLIWQTTNSRSNGFAGRLGLEYRYQLNKGWYLVAGLDLVTRYYSYQRVVEQITWKIDSVINPGPEQYYQKTMTDRKTLLEVKSTAYLAGIGFTFGAIIPAGKRLLILAQFRADSYLGPYKTRTSNFVTGTTINRTSFDFSVNTGSPISELSLFYRF